LLSTSIFEALYLSPEFPHRLILLRQPFLVLIELLPFRFLPCFKLGVILPQLLGLFNLCSHLLIDLTKVVPKFYILAVGLFGDLLPVDKLSLLL
jgi:hypothetical protein